jgi:hypothetical protein
MNCDFRIFVGGRIVVTEKFERTLFFFRGEWSNVVAKLNSVSVWICCVDADAKFVINLCNGVPVRAPIGTPVV